MYHFHLNWLKATAIRLSFNESIKPASERFLKEQHATTVPLASASLQGIQDCGPEIPNEPGSFGVSISDDMVTHMLEGRAYRNIGLAHASLRLGAGLTSDSLLNPALKTQPCL